MVGIFRGYVSHNQMVHGYVSHNLVDLSIAMLNYQRVPPLNQATFPVARTDRTCQVVQLATAGHVAPARSFSAGRLEAAP